MSKNSNVNNNRSQEPNNMFVQTTGGGKNAPKQIHVAHRRSQSELTNLMIEQFTLQKQLEQVQAQQQQLMAQQQQLAQQTGQYLSGNSGSNNHFTPQPPHPHYNSNGNSPGMSAGGSRSRTHSRNNSGYYHNSYDNNNNSNNPGSNSHRKTSSQSSIYGHSRRHSLGLNEAKKAAAEEQAKRISGDEAGVTVKIDSVQADSGSNSTTEQSDFKFPPPPNAHQGHRRATSNLSPPSFKFPPNSHGDNDDEFIATSSTHRRSKTRNNEYSPGINSNWRNQSQQPQQQLSPFRHRGSNSRDYNSFNTLEPPAIFQQGHKHRASNSSVHSFSSQGNNNGGGRKSLFAPYLPQANIPELIQEGRLVAGILRVNKKNRSDAWVSTDGALDADIYICGSKDRNRALEGDLVAVELLVVDDVWESKKEKEEKKRRKDASMQHDLIPLNSSDDYHNDASVTAATSNNFLSSPSSSDSLSKDDLSVRRKRSSTINNDSDSLSSPTKSGVRRRSSLKQRPTQKKNDDVEVEGQSLLLVEEEEINDKYKPLYAGHVVAVLDRIPGQLFSGTLGLLRPSQQANSDNNKPPQSPKIAWFKPTDKKVPLIAIPTELAPKDFVENADKYSEKLFVASIKRWPITSLHPFGILVSELGDIHDPDTEIDFILRDNNFLSNEYLDQKNPQKEKPSFQPLPLTAESLEYRRNFTDTNEYNIFAISELGWVSEFALHVRNNGNGTLELGCHVVDVTSHIEEGSSVDRRARKRSSAVFMPQKLVNLLPQSFNDELSLAPGKESATLSVVYTLDSSTLRIKSTWVGESTISPSNILSLEQLDEKLSTGSPSSYLSTVQEIARSFYARRINDPEATLLPTLSLLESLDDEKVKVDLNILDRTLGFVVINEIKRKVNSTVAEKIYTKLGDLALLRRQMQPIATKMASFRKKIQNFGYNFDTNTADELIKGVLKIKDDDVRVGIEILLFKTMPRARYFIAGKVDPDQYGHYALNLPIYTHFTAPMRRYADHVVHRQLKAVIHDTPYTEDMEALKITSEYCNFKKDCAYQAQEQAIHLLLCKTINDMGNTTGQLLTMATVLQVYESSFDVFIPEFGIEKRVHGDQLPLIKAEFDGTNRVLELHWQPGVDSATFIPADEKNPKSYRNSIKNKFRSTAAEIANIELDKEAESEPLISDPLSKELSDLHLTVPNLRLPSAGDKKQNPLEKFISTTETRIENDNYIQEIHELQKIPILLRAEVGMALPCLTVRALNPFMKRA
ncbi:CLL_collapsed_G0011230.mRNA.1.CDS.1 [Saccharomyces cerevisiae]|uniref:K7_Ssd1p n=1 Tax=Saccharomyces cerevisiae (strain Kyokai no. 7 / NBRC 101557) TaxID=721032 RepID=G2WB31_YEASK|nr:CLN_G0011450.mRNA.1.CDS.1 [Saccharomyces cerevisiae]GAA22513.1 K7_Ssd1p [Saccharomyces cerevisiae Kyokai no. 7]CAI4362544.1 ADQ_G0011440.mRNA.1.CDS.1 [Saccharomyces cerevisiae]CAI5240078.1 CLL_HP2_G0010230.mRNA.1.CDS.1 [Saccharomyces cerevisiae]CAI5252024.1 CMF_HP2_G0011400.mRNA.1.CDS.1 [Saccharomyces cerevisiae]